MLSSSPVNSALALALLAVPLCVFVSASTVQPGQASYASDIGKEPPAVTTAYSTRNISEYESLLPGDQTTGSPGTDSWRQEETRAKQLLIRKFVWEHWRDRRRGHVRVKWKDGQGRGVEWHVFVEPDKKGEWRLIKISTYTSNGSVPRAITYEARRVVRVTASNWRVVSKHTKVDVTDYQLANINARNEVVSLDFCLYTRYYPREAELAHAAERAQRDRSVCP